MKLDLALLFLFLPLLAGAQNLEKVNNKLEKTWQGTIMLLDGRELNCYFTYNPLLPGGLLLVKTDTAVNVYVPEKVLGFSFFDDELNYRRYFYSLPFKLGEVDKHFFELIHETDQIAILGSSTIENKSNRSSGKIWGGLFYEVALRKNDHSSATRTKVENRYKWYLLDHRDNIIYSLSKQELLRMVDDRIDQVKLFLRQNSFQLKEVNIGEFIDLINYYSSLKKP